MHRIDQALLYVLFWRGKILQRQMSDLFFLIKFIYSPETRTYIQNNNVILDMHLVSDEYCLMDVIILVPLSYSHIETDTRWQPCRRRYFQLRFLR